MKKLFVSLLFVLLMTSAALAVISPHTPTLGCTACHVNPSNYLLGITGVNNLCLTCHNPSLMTEGFLPGDIANPFNSTNLGLYASGMKHTSHNWVGGTGERAGGRGCHAGQFCHVRSLCDSRWYDKLRKLP